MHELEIRRLQHFPPSPPPSPPSPPPPPPASYVRQQLGGLTSLQAPPLPKKLQLDLKEDQKGRSRTGAGEKNRRETGAAGAGTGE